jgi:hypothetical protein
MTRLNFLVLGALLSLFVANATGAATAAAAAAPVRIAFGGEDFPFFCSVAAMTEGKSHTSFKVVPNVDSPTGFTMILWQRLRLRAIIPVRITESENGRYWIISGRARARLNWFVDDQVLAYVARDADLKSHGDTQVTWHNESATEWELSPMSCRNY